MQLQGSLALNAGPDLNALRQTRGAGTGWRLSHRPMREDSRIRSAQAFFAPSQLQLFSDSPPRNGAARPAAARPAALPAHASEAG